MTLVNWCTGVDKYDILPMKDFYMPDGSLNAVATYEIDSKYKVRFNDKNYWAFLKFIGKYGS
jgi:hypothetical protein